MMNTKNSWSDLIGHLGLIAEIIDREAGAQVHNKKISFGKAVVCMILNGLGFIGRILDLYSEYFDNKPLNHLLGTQHFKRLLQKNKSLFVTHVPATHEKVKEIFVLTSKEKLFPIGEGYFVLSTNNLNHEKFPPQEVLKIYKAQQSVERGFRFLKSPDFLIFSFYLKKPQRIKALLMVMTLCLLVYSAIKYKMRSRLKALNLYFVDQKNPPYQNPTVRWIFFCFLSLDILIFEGKNIRVTKDKA